MGKDKDRLFKSKMLGIIEMVKWPCQTIVGKRETAALTDSLRAIVSPRVPLTQHPAHPCSPSPPGPDSSELQGATADRLAHSRGSQGKSYSAAAFFHVAGSFPPSVGPWSRVKVLVDDS